MATPLLTPTKAASMTAQLNTAQAMLTAKTGSTMASLQNKPQPAPVTPAPGSAASIAPPRFTLAPTADEAAANAARARVLQANNADASLSVDPVSEYNAKLRTYQGQIDAENSVYQDKLNTARLAGQGRLGSSRAMQGRSGLLGSDFGAAQTDQVTNANTDETNALADAHGATLAAIQGLARKDATDSLTAKAAAKKAGADALLKYYTEDVPTQKTGRIGKVAQALYDKQIDPTTLTPAELKQLTGDWNVSADDITSGYSTIKTAKDAEATKIAQEAQKAQSAADLTTAQIAQINEGIRKGKYQSVNEGESIIDTTTGKVIYSKPKTYAPKDTSGSGLTPYQQFQATQSISKDNMSRTSNAREIARQVGIMNKANASIKNGGDVNLGSQAIIATFNKILDPTSVVRESEYDRTAQGQSLLERIQGKYDNISSGGAGVTAKTLSDAVALGNEYLKGAQASMLEQNKRAEAMATHFGLDPSFVTSATPQTGENDGPDLSGMSDDELSAIANGK